MNSESMISSILPLLTGALGAWLSYLFTSRAKRNEAIQKFKEEKYAHLLVLLQGFVGCTASAETKRRFFEEQYRSWLYSSDEVVRAMNHMVQLVIDGKGAPPDQEEGRKAVGNIVIAMRKDLLGKTALQHFDFTYTDVVEDGGPKRGLR